MSHVITNMACTNNLKSVLYSNYFKYYCRIQTVFKVVWKVFQYRIAVRIRVVRFTKIGNMELRYSRNSILPLELITRVASVFCLTPWYSFSKRRLIGKYFHKVYVTLFTCAVVLLVGTVMYLRVENTNTQFISNVLFFLHDTNSFLFWIFAILGTASWNIPTWRRVFKLFHRLENQCSYNKKRKINCKVNFTFVLGHVNVCFLIIGFSITNFGKDLTIFQILVFTYLVLFYYLKFLFCNLVFNMAIFIRHGYVSMNEMITDLFKFDQRLNLSKIKKATQLLLVLDNIIKEFNQLFGWPILLQLADFVLDSLSSIVYALNTSEWLYTPTSAKVMALYLLASKVRLLLLICQCHRTCGLLFVADIRF